MLRVVHVQLPTHRVANHVPAQDSCPPVVERRGQRCEVLCVTRIYSYLLSGEVHRCVNPGVWWTYEQQAITLWQHVLFVALFVALSRSSPGSPS